jgi:predicted sugar kinase
LIVSSKGEKVKNVLLDALRKRYEAQIAEADATIKIYFENSVGIGEHPQHVDEVDKLIEKISTAEEKLEVIKEFE